jgi:AMP-activated protein kinase-like protein/5'-AMP-activated protein kinase beta subunit-like protein
MGNSASSGTHNPPVTNTPQDRDNREKPTPHPVHRSLRTKKKSLELPDLASLSLTPAPSHLNSPNHSPRPHYRRPKPSSPIPIPSQAAASNGVDHHYQSYPRPNLPSTTQMPDVLVQQQPHTHIPIFPPTQRHRSTPNASTRSFSRPPQATHLPPIRDIDQGCEPETRTTPFLPETICSTIPLGLAQEDVPQPPTRARLSPIDEPSHPVDVKISWRGVGKTVFLARAGDAGWKGRQAMERRCVLHLRLPFIFTTSCSSNPNHSSSDPDTFTTRVPLVPGTHHVKFVVDDNWRLAQDLPTAVDDDGTLANYVTVPLPAGPSAPASPPPTLSNRHAHQISFWSQSSDAGVPTPFGDEGWTSAIPSELVAAAREEEAYLANPAAGTAPNIPPAPVLPRHLDKLILNTRVGPSTPSPAKDRRHRARSRHGETARPEQDELPAASSSHIPVTTASGTDVSAALHGHPNPHSQPPVRTLVGVSPAPQGTAAAAMVLADDGSVLPVPSHVVLHHLSTSAIRNGVLAVGNTTRYKKKVRHILSCT